MKCGQQQICLFFKIGVRQKMIGQPKRGAVDQNYGIGCAVVQDRAKMKGRLDRGPIWPAVAAVAGNAVTHLVIKGLGGCDIQAWLAGFDGKGFSKT